MRHNFTRLTASLTVLALVAGLGTEASAATARHIYGKGHGYAGRSYHHYGRSSVGPAVAGAALGIIGLAAGAAAAHSYNRYDDGYGYEPGYAYGGYGAAPYVYNGYGYGYQPY